MATFKGQLETKTGTSSSDVLYPETSVDQLEGLPIPTSADEGKVICVDEYGHYILVKLSSDVTATITNGLSVDNVVLYDGQDNTGTQLGILLMGETETYTITSGYIYAEWDDQQFTEGTPVFVDNGNIVGNPLEITSDITLTMGVVIPYITFSGANTFNLATYNTTANWDGTLYYSTDRTTWNTWDGTSIASVNNGSEYVIYLRGSGNTYITGEDNNNKRFNLTGSASTISCSGNIENLLDYATVLRGQHPTMANYCFTRLFYLNGKLVSPPEFPAMSLSNFCYAYMFASCSNLLYASDLPATTLVEGCYKAMYQSCLKVPTPAKIAGGTTQAISAKECCWGMHYNNQMLNMYTTGTTPVYKSLNYGTKTTDTDYNATFRMFYSCKIDGVSSTVSYLTPGVQYYY